MLHALAELSSAASTAASAALPPSFGPIPTILFYAFALITVLAAFSVALARNIVRAAVALLFALAGVSGLYFMLNAEFLAAVQLVVYVGGTLILMIFGVMLTTKTANSVYDAKRLEVIWALAVAILLAVPLAWLMLSVRWHSAGSASAIAAQQIAASTQPYPIEQLGIALLDPAAYLVPFELASVVLLAVMIGAAYLAKSRKLPTVAQSLGKSPSVLRNTRDHHGIEFAAETHPAPLPDSTLQGKPGASGRGTE